MGGSRTGTSVVLLQFDYHRQRHDPDDNDNVNIDDDGNDNNRVLVGARVMHFSHFSVKKFLTSFRLVNSSRDVSHYHILLDPAHTIMAQACLSILLRSDDPS